VEFAWREPVRLGSYNKMLLPFLKHIRRFPAESVDFALRRINRCAELGDGSSRADYFGFQNRSDGHALASVFSRQEPEFLSKTITEILR